MTAQLDLFDLADGTLDAQEDQARTTELRDSDVHILRLLASAGELAHLLDDPAGTIGRLAVEQPSWRLDGLDGGGHWFASVTAINVSPRGRGAHAMTYTRLQVWAQSVPAHLHGSVITNLLHGEGLMTT